MFNLGKYLEKEFHLEELSVAERNKQRLAVELAIWIVFAGSIYNLIYITLGYSSVIISSVTSIVVTLLNLLIFRISGDFRFFRTAQLIIILVFGLITHALLGGFVDSSGLALCAILPSIGALLFSTRRTARFLFALYCIGLVVLGLMEWQQFDIPYRMPRWMSLTFFVTNFIFISAIIYFIIESFHSKMIATQINLQKEKEKSESLLLNILPAGIIEELKNTGHYKAKLFNHVTVVFTDFVNFTNISETMNPEELVAEIDLCFKAFDEISERNELEKIKTIGDAYLAVCGLPNEDEMHAIKAVQAAIEIMNFTNKRRAQGGKFDIRIGIHSGPLVAGIVGVKKFAYDIWGDTVNTASRMESSGDIGKINISGSTYELIKDKFTCTNRGKIEAKHKGMIDMYFVENIM
jgi:class 3 adenylate cyclase